MDESTKAAEPLLDATEPAPAEDATQSIYAWSEHADDDTELIQRRSWKLPIALTALTAAAAITTGVAMLWPAKTTPPPSQTPPAAASPDIAFINLINDRLKGTPGFRGAQYGDPDAIATGHLVCEKMSTMWPTYGPNARRQIIQWMVTEGGAPSQPVAATVENSAEHAYCPEYPGN
jgi:hypothetical protein